MPDESDIKIMIEMYPNLFESYLYGKPLKGENGMKLCVLSGYKILEDGSGINDSDEDDMLPDLDEAEECFRTF